MKFSFLIILAIAVYVALSGCVVTGSVEYTDPESGATASLGVNHQFKSRDGKTVKPNEK